MIYHQLPSRALTEQNYQNSGIFAILSFNGGGGVSIANLARVFERMNYFRWEVQIGISTGGIVEIDKPDSTHYASIDYSVIHKVLPEITPPSWTLP